ncbi:hypothetical protein [Corynebacterium matruchotii]|nr:hypothetical protein [Corynebacterium matruchotii]
MKTKVLVTLALIVAYLLMAIFHINQQVMAPVMCAAIAAVLFWPARRKK